jgi:hypothetical protein
MEQFCRLFGLALLGGTQGVMLSQGLWPYVIPLFIGMLFYIVYANWER